MNQSNSEDRHWSGANLLRLYINGLIVLVIAFVIWKFVFLYSPWYDVIDDPFLASLLTALSIILFPFVLGAIVVFGLDGGGSLSDHYDPRTKNISLSERIYREPSVASAAIAAHETGHAIQDKEYYGPMRFRSAMMPLVQLGAQYGPYAIMGGWLFGSSNVMLIGFLMFAGTLLFQLLTLPVEFNASHRAKKQLEEMGFTTEQDRVGAHKVLRAAAMTYVAGAATAMGKLFVILLFAGRSLFRRLLPAPK